MTPDRPTRDQIVTRLEQTEPPQRTGRARIFVIFDTEHDADLYALLHAQSQSPDCEFSVTGGSAGASDTEDGRERTRGRIRAADQVIVLCGEHAELSQRIHRELLAAQEEQKPYCLVWGRRGVMCGKPIGSKPADGMYSWTRQILHDQIALNFRQRTTDKEIRKLSHGPRKLPTASGIAPAQQDSRDDLPITRPDS